MHPLPSALLSLLTALSLLHTPPPHRPLPFLLLLLPTTHAFLTHASLTPWRTLNDTFARFLYIWAAHTSHVFLIARFTPQAGARRHRWTEAWGVLFGRPEGPRRRGAHGLGMWEFCKCHVRVLGVATGALCAWEAFVDRDFVPGILGRGGGAEAWWESGMMVFAVCLGDMLFFSALYSGFALLFVGVLRVDAPPSWGLRLFGSLGDCWSVRRYWGVYWHDYVYASFSAHAKLVTRGWLRLREPSATRRALENGMVFVASGLAHSAVRWVQTQGEGEVWTVAIWYAAQMLPILVEGVVERFWSDAMARRWLGEKFGEKRVVVMERIVGYTWVFCWMFWSVPKYIRTRNAWENAKLREKYPELFGGMMAFGLPHKNDLVWLLEEVQNEN
ncbi:hypothetical protein EJ07DRAFT_129988 [Lizonia empirigonia]|nr:hypothetical protein EJ07DRAFT_129988 [Lizonia empirigonia]